MKKLTIILLGLIFISVVVAQPWREVLAPTYPGGTIFYSGFMASKNVGYIVGNNGIILKTTNGGMTWAKLNSGVTRTLYSVFFLNEQLGFAGGSSRTLLKTTNGGITWDSISVSIIPETGAAIYGIYFADSLKGWMIASTSSSGWILSTNDGGTSWKIDTVINKQLYAMHFAKPGKGIVVGKDAGTIWYTKDGIVWNNAPAPNLSQFPYTRTDIRSVFMINENLAIAVGWGSFAAGLQPSIILKTTNGGETWTLMVQSEENRTYDNLYSVWFKDSLNGIAVGGGIMGAIVIKTTDGGNTWVPLGVGIGATLYSGFGTGDTLIGAGSDGVIVRTPDFGNSGELITKIPGATIYSIQILNSGVIYAAGYDGIFLKSKNWGNSWGADFVSSRKATPNVNAIHFLNDDTGFAACSYRLLVRTKNGGESWEILLPDTLATTTHLYGVYFINWNKGFAVGQLATNKDVIYKTLDGGLTWAVRSNIASNAWRAVKFSTPNKGIIVGTKLKALYTVDGGETWNLATFKNVPASLASADLRDVAFLNESVAVAVGNKIILKTTDGGATWNYVDSTTTLLYSVSFANDRVGYAVGSGTILKTTDGGTTWTNIYDPNVIKQSIYSVSADTGGYPWIGCSYSYIYTTAPVVSVKDLNYVLPDYKLYQNYPNPFNPITTIKFSIPEKGDVTIKVFDLLGREVATIVSGQTFEAGEHYVNFRADGLPSGVYLYQLRVNGYSQTRKMIYIK